MVVEFLTRHELIFSNTTPSTYCEVGELLLLATLETGEVLDCALRFDMFGLMFDSRFCVDECKMWEGGLSQKS